MILYFETILETFHTGPGQKAVSVTCDDAD